MRTLTLATRAFKIPDSIIQTNTLQINQGDFTIVYQDRMDLTFIEKSSTCKIIVDGLIEGLEKPQITDKFFTENTTLNGQYTIFDISKGRIRIATDFININRFAFYQDINLGILISNNLEDLLDILKYNNVGDSKLGLIDPIALIEQLGYQYSTLGNRTLIKGVNYIQNGSITEIDSNGVKVIAVDSIERCSLQFSDSEYQEILKSNAELFNKKFSDVCFPISGGVDSRITLHSFESCENKKKYTTITHGEIDDIEVVIGLKLSHLLGLKHRSISIQNLYPSREKAQQILQKGWNWVLGKWLPIIEEVINSDVEKDTLFILGDTLDLLRAKNIKSIRSRKKRILIQLGLVCLNPENILIDDIKMYYTGKVVNDLNSTFNNYKDLFHKLGVGLDQLLIEVEKDLMTTLNHVERLFRPRNGYEFEEGLNLIIWGRGTMGYQARYINQYYPCYVAHANRQFIKTIVCVNQAERFEDKLVHRLLKKSNLSKIATSQIPILHYHSPLYLKYFVWAIRSFLDQYYMKAARKFGFRRNRLFKIQNWQTIYADAKNAENFRSYFSGLEPLMSYPLNYYENRASGKSRALSEIDLTNAAQVALILKKMGLKQ